MHYYKYGSIFWFSIMLVLLNFTALPHMALAHAGHDPATCIETHGKLEVPLPGIPEDFLCNDLSLVVYVKAVINFVTALIVIVGLLSIIVGGYFYMTAGGSADRVSMAKTLVMSALLGIVLALTAWVILNTVGPQFTTEVTDPVINEP